MPSGAGLNRFGSYGGVAILSTSATSGTVDSGAIVAGGEFFSKWSFQIIPFAPSTSFSGHSIVVYGTIDPNAILYYQNQLQGTTPNLGDFPSTSWFPLPAPSSEDAAPDTYAWANPLTTAGQSLYSPMALTAIRALDTITDGTGAVTLLAMAIP